MEPTKQPQVKLKGIEYLLLAIQSEPGKSQRHYLRRLHQYKYGVEDYHKGGTCCGYFISPSYRDVLWHDTSQREGVKRVRYECFSSVNESYYSPSCSGYTRRSFRTKASRMHLTWAGWIRANEVRQKLGLDPIPMGCFDD